MNEKRHCNKCHQERIVCKHGFCELCDAGEEFDCFTRIVNIHLPERKHAQGKEAVQ